LGETPFGQVAQHGPTVRQRPYMTREIETWLSECRSVTIVGLTIEADDQSSLHCITVSTDVTSDHTGHERSVWDAMTAQDP